MRLARTLLIWMVLLTLGSPLSAVAAEVPRTGDQAPRTTAVITGPDDIGVGRTIILDASASHIAGERPEYRWTIEETREAIGRSVEAIFTPEKPGRITFRLTVKSTNLTGGTEESTALHSVVVFRRKIVIVADVSIPLDKLQGHVDQAMENGVYVKVVRVPDGTTALNTEDALVTILTEQKSALAGADSIVIWTDGIAGLQALMRSVSGNSEREAAMRNQSVILLTEQSLSTLARPVRGAFSVLHPKQIILTRKEAVNPLIDAPDSEQFLTTLAGRDVDFRVLTAVSARIMPWDVFSALVNYMLSHGVGGQTVILLLMLPIIATVFAFLKQVVGITTFGLYTPSIVALSFLALGWKVGLLFLMFILVTGYVTRSLMRRWRLLYIPKVAIILTVVSLTLLVLVALSSWFGFTFTREAVFILLILSTLAENFINLKTEEGWWSAFLAIGETVVGALLCVYLVQLPSVQSTILAYPELIFLTILLNILLGRWTGLRLVEYFRFREVFRHLQEE